MLKSLGFGLGLETFANFWKVSVLVSENLVSEKKSHIWFRNIWSRKKSISLGFGEFGLGKKVSVSVLKNLVSEKSLGIGFAQNFGIVIQYLQVDLLLQDF